MAKRVTLGNYIGGEWRGARSGETYEKRNPMHPDEVAAMICWLASEEMSFSTGACFDISGGRAVY